MSCSKSTRRLHFQSLEDRRLRAIDLDADVLTIDATNLSEFIEVREVGDDIVAEIEPYSSNYGAYRESESFSVNSVRRIRIFASGGNDTVINNTNLPSEILGGSGEDRLVGGLQDDIIHGGDHYDRIWGDFGFDQLHGDGGRDLIFGESGNDTIDGGPGDDGLYGDFAPFSEKYKPPGARRSNGIEVEGDDVIYGRDGGDTLWGGGERDILMGGPEDDYLDGEAGDDDLYGGDHGDVLMGGPGYDGLYGGPGADYLDGGDEADRLLLDDHNEDTIHAFHEDTDATVHFVNTPKEFEKHDDNDGVPESTWGARSWTADEIQLVDKALGELHRIIGATTLLNRDVSGTWNYDTDELYPAGTIKNVRVRRVADQIDGSESAAAAWNNSLDTEVVLTDRTFFEEGNREDESEVLRIVWHEFGHNWDEENPWYNEFKALSGWVDYVVVDDKHTVSGDGEHSYANDATFAWEYGAHKPTEDFATAFAAYFMQRTGRTSRHYVEGFGPDAIAEKLAFLDDFFARLADNAGTSNQFTPLNFEK